MSVDLDRKLRAVLLEIVDVAPPVGLAVAAIRTRKRQRLRTISALAAGLAVVTALTLTMPGLLRSPTPASYTPSHVVLVYRFGTDSNPVGDFSSVLDPESGTYERLPYHTVVPSPDGKWLFTAEGSGFDRLGILDRATDEVSWLPGVRSGPRARNGPRVGRRCCSPTSGRTWTRR